MNAGPDLQGGFRGSSAHEADRERDRYGGRGSSALGVAAAGTHRPRSL
ncbi:MAG: hypothetical protein ACTHMX_07285 [Thermomicrobiales bacterium]